MKFTFKGCTITINFYFFAIAAIISLFDSGGMMIGGIISAMLHEFGHLTAMMVIPGQIPAEVNVTPFGMRIKNNPVAEFMRGRITVLAAGSAVNLALAVIFISILPHFAAMNFILGTMNLLPVDTLDGGGIMKNLLCRRFSEKISECILTVISIVVLIALAFVGVYILFRTRYNFTLLGMALWLLVSVILHLIKK